MTIITLQIVKPFLDPKTFKKVKFVYAKNVESQKILGELFEEDTIKSTFEDPNDYSHEEYAKLMQDDDLKSSLHWKLAGETKPEVTEVQTDSKDLPSVEGIKAEDATTANGNAEAPVEAAPASEPVAAQVTPPAEEAPSAPPAATLVSAPTPAPVVAPVS